MVDRPLVAGLLAGGTCVVSAAEPARVEVKRDTGPAEGPALGAGLKCIGRVRTRRSEAIAGSRWGVSCHWIADQHELTTDQRVEQLAELGAKWGFLVPDWDRIEREKGKYDFNAPNHRLDEAVRGMARRKIRPIIQIYGGNRLYMPTGLDPNKRRLANAARLLDDPETRRAWHRFLETLVRRYQADVKVWEIWNEPNGPWFWHGPTTVEQYGRMVEESAAIIKRIDPQATILAGSTAMIPLDYFRAFLESDGARSFDFCSVHPYGALPERADGAVRELQQLLAGQGKSPVLWQSECGFPSSGDTGGWGFGGPWNETKHAKWVLRRLLADAALDMQASIYFVLNDYPSLLEAGPDRGKMGINRKGLHFAGSWEPKPAAHAFRNLASLIDDRLEPKPIDCGPEIVGAGMPAGRLSGAGSDRMRTYTLADRATGSPVVVYWLAVPIETQSAVGRIRLSLPGDSMQKPVLVDLLDGRCYAVEGVGRDGRTVFDALPVADSPLVLCSRGLLEVTP